MATTKCTLAVTLLHAKGRKVKTVTTGFVTFGPVVLAISPQYVGRKDGAYVLDELRRDQRLAEGQRKFKLTPAGGEILANVL